MKVKHVLMIAAVLLAMLVMPVAASNTVIEQGSGPQTAGATLTRTEGTGYTITIPDTITFEEGLNLEATKVLLNNGASLVVTVSSMGEWNLILDGSPDDKLKYQMLIGGVANSEDTPKVLEVAHPALSGSKMLTFKKLEDAQKAGTYNDTLTFTVSIVEGGADEVTEFYVSSTEALLSATKNDGVTVYLQPGEYEDIEFTAGTNLGNRVTIIGTEGAKVNGITLVGYSFTTLEGTHLTIQDVFFDGKGVFLDISRTGQHTHLWNMSLINCIMEGSGSSNNIAGNRLFDIGTDSPGSDQIHNILIKDCKVNNTFQGMRLGGLDQYNVIKDNTITNVGHNAITLRSVSSVGTVLVEGNKISNGDDRAFRIGANSGVVNYVNNIITNSGDEAEGGSNFKANSLGTVTFENNTVDGVAWNPLV